MIAPEIARPRLAEWLAGPMRRQRRTYMRVALAAGLINLFGLATAMFSMTVYDRVVPNEAIASLVALSIGLGIVIIFDFALRILRAYFVDLAGADIDREIGGAVFARLMALKLGQHRGSTGAMAGLIRELESLRDLFASATLVAIVDVPFVLLSLAIIAMVGGWVVLVPLAAIPLVVLTGLFVQPAMDRLSRSALVQGAAKQAVLVEALGAIETVKTSRADAMLSARWDSASMAQAASACRQRMVSTVAMTVASSANMMAYAGVVIVGVFLIASRDLTTGGLVACTMLVGRALAPLGQIAQMLSRLAATRTAYRQIDALMTMPVEGEGVSPVRIDGGIRFRDVTFAYPGGGPNVFQGLNLDIAPGERVALLGRIGSGKSTLARLAMGLYAPQQGQVLIDGCDIRQYDLSALRAHMGVALQDAALFSGTVRDNITLMRDGIDDAEMLRAAQLSGAHDFMGGLANGYELLLADRGDGLSGGQRQAISIARALAGSPAMLVFDEPTSAMDADTELRLIERLAREVEGRTMVMVTHRPSLLRLATRIVVLGGGRVIDDGPRAEILQKLVRKAA